MEKLGNYSLPVTEWAKKLPNKKIAAVSPQTKTAADLVASHKDIHVQDFDFLELDGRVNKNVNIELKYRTVTHLEKYTQFNSDKELSDSKEIF